MFVLRRLRKFCTRSMASAEFTTQVLKCDPSSITFPSDEPVISCHDTADAIKAAAHHLVALEQPVVFPTETVYGLGGLALKSEAAAKIFSTKGRPADNPLIVHVSSMNMLRSLLPPDYTIPDTYQALMKAFWPGPLTLLFPRNPSVIPSIITAGQPTVAIRMPAHPVARALIAISDAPLAAPSANTSGKPSPTRAMHVAADLNGKVPLILDGGACGFGLESTVVDGLAEDGHLRVLRPGGVTVEDLERVLREEMPVNARAQPRRVLVHKRDYADEQQEQAPTTPGMKYRHYSPSVPVVLLSTLPDASRTSVAIATYLETLTATLLSSFFCPPSSPSSSSSSSPTAPPSSISIGVLAATDSHLWAHLPSPSSDPRIIWQRHPLGPLANPDVIAHNLFDGLLSLEKAGVRVMLIEEVSEEREGLAIMNRVRKAASETVAVTLS
ncbi:hypothetical protein D9619_000340 [Psilocybe cf. subviscida]|uniref:Threonylcarbamoyl-AMP synthase n=1 Tax=Psilocybe cf. subviscida TaxID=2480587 RepID=A0A8H5F2R3_9AGAR|nr:hypothetical protein D9619_000340 [Psilocybe cf. subviscida]